MAISLDNIVSPRLSTCSNPGNINLKSLNVNLNQHDTPQISVRKQFQTLLDEIHQFTPSSRINFCRFIKTQFQDEEGTVSLREEILRFITQPHTPTDDIFLVFEVLQEAIIFKLNRNPDFLENNSLMDGPEGMRFVFESFKSFIELNNDKPWEDASFQVMIALLPYIKLDILEERVINKEKSILDCIFSLIVEKSGNYQNGQNTKLLELTLLILSKFSDQFQSFIKNNDNVEKAQFNGLCALLISAKIEKNPVFFSKLENNWRKLYGLHVNQGNLKLLRELQNKNQKLEDKIAQIEAENNRDFSCLTVNLGQGNNNNYGQQIIGNNVHVNNILQTSGQYPMPGFNSNATQLSRMRADSQTSTYSDSLNINNLSHPIKSHETTNSASFNSETMTMNATNNNQNQSNSNFSNNLLAEFNKMKAENNRLRERNEDLEENYSKLRNHLFSMKNQASGKNNNSSGSKSDSDKSRKSGVNGLNSIGNETLTNGEQNRDQNREFSINIEFGTQNSNRNSSEMNETATINDETNTNADGETTTTLELDDLLESDELIKKRQEIYQVNVKLDDERKKKTHWQEKYKEKSKAYSDIKNRYGRADRQWMEEKRRRTDIESHHEQVYACTRNKLKIVNDAKSCLEAENRSMKRLLDEMIVRINQEMTEKYNEKN